MAVGGYGYPPPAEFLANWYVSNGQCIDCTEADRADPYAAVLERVLSEMKLTPDAPNGALQITATTSVTPEPDDSMMGCVSNANSLAVGDPEWSKRVGHEGLIKIYMACHAEARGFNEPGFTQEVVTLLTTGPSKAGGVDKKWLWIGGGILAFLVLRTK